MSLSARTLALGHHAGSALLGVDALYRAESRDGDGLAVLNMADPEELPPQHFADYDEAQACFEELRRHSADLPEPDRRLYYDQLCRSTIAFVRWRRDGLAFETRLTDFLHVPSRSASDNELEDLQAELHELLGALGYRGNLAARCRNWEARHRVDPQDVPTVLTELLAEAWDRTEERLLEIPAPREDGMKVAPVSGVAYNARCDYQARTIELNTDPVLTRPGLKHLAVHEGYPGHYVQFKLRETMARAGEAAADVLLSVVNTASSSVFEGIADAGMAMIGWDDGGDDRVQALLNRYRAGLVTAAAWRLHTTGLPVEEVADWLRARSLVGGDGWVDNRMRFIAADARAVLIWSYWWGEPSVASAWAGVQPADRPRFLRWLHGNMHSVQSVRMFATRSTG